MKRATPQTDVAVSRASSFNAKAVLDYNWHERILDEAAPQGFFWFRSSAGHISRPVPGRTGPYAHRTRRGLRPRRNDTRTACPTRRACIIFGRFGGCSMNVYDADHIRNVALVGHQGSGKTMLAEAMLLSSGAIRRMGSIEANNTVSDFHPSEHEWQMSVFASLLHAEWKGHKINILDTPGYPDFMGEVIASLKVADTAIFVMNAIEGVQVGTELAWTYGEMIQKPSMFVINHMDNPSADFRMLVSQLKERFGNGATVVQLPGGAGSRTIIDVLLMKQLTFPEDGGEPTIAEISDEFRAEAEDLHTTLIEDIAENDEGLMELYFEKGELDEDEMRQGLSKAMLHRQLFPIFVTSATASVGVSRLMSFIDNVLPSPKEMPPAEVVSGDPVVTDPSGPPIALVYKTMAEQHVGDYSFLRIYSGTLSQGMDLENAQTSTMERLGQL